MNLTIFNKSTPHALRALSLATFPPAFVILLIAGIVLGQVNPAIGLIPLFFSAAYAALLLSNERKCGCQADGLTGTLFHFILDFVIGAALLLCLILAWVFMGQYRRPRAGIILGTYGTTFLIFNFLVHLYFVLCQLKKALVGGQTHGKSCTQCQSGTIAFSFGGFQFGKEYSFGGGSNRGYSGRSKNGYAPLLDGDGEPRVSADERPNGGEDMV